MEDSKGFTIQINVPPGIEALIPKVLAFLNNFDGSKADPAAPDEIITADELCALLKVPKTKIYAMTMRTGPGSIPRFKVGRDLRFKRSEVLPWFEQQRIK